MVRVGVTSSSPAAAKEYVSALALAGADSFVLENDVASCTAQLGGCDGILLTGGLDLDPALYGEARHPTTKPAKRERDDFEGEVLRRARVRGLPLLAICRGLQAANVTFGGTLIQDVPTEIGTRIAHAPTADGQPFRGVVAEHIVSVETDCALAGIVGTTRLATGSRHHQAVKTVAAELRSVASTSDGVIEALEARFPSPFWLAVQWHPESTLDDGGPSRAIFARFVAACVS